MIRLKSICILLIAYSNTAYSQYNDWKQQGLKGRVKSITTFVYDDLEFTNDEWVPRSIEKYTDSIVVKYNQQGMIDTLIENVFLEPNNAKCRLSVYQYKDNKNVSVIQYENGRKLNDLYQISRINDYKRNVVILDSSDSKIFEESTVLSHSYLDSVVELIYYKQEEVVFHKTYSYYYDSSGQFRQSDIKDLIDKRSEIVVFQNSNFDIHGNETKIVGISLFNFKVENLLLRRIEYYE